MASQTAVLLVGGRSPNPVVDTGEPQAGIDRRQVEFENTRVDQATGGINQDL